jgi:YggT family protein
MSSLLAPLIEVLLAIIDLFKWCLIGSIVLSWLISFNVVNVRNRAVYMINDVLYRITEPALRPLRRIIPATGSLDLSPIALFFILWLIQSYLGMFLGHLIASAPY